MLKIDDCSDEVNIYIYLIVYFIISQSGLIHKTGFTRAAKESAESQPIFSRTAVLFGL